jgi:dCMP deaminase
MSPTERPRPTWDEVWSELATTLSLRSTCARLQVGCVVVTEDNQKVLGVGYNGGPKGISNECLSLEPGLCGHLHAEVNALIKADYTSPAKKKMYVTNQPCYQCAVAIINANISEVFYIHPYRLTDGLQLLEKAGIKITKLGG